MSNFQNMIRTALESEFDAEFDTDEQGVVTEAVVDTAEEETNAEAAVMAIESLYRAQESYERIAAYSNTEDQGLYRAAMESIDLNLGLPAGTAYSTENFVAKAATAVWDAIINFFKWVGGLFKKLWDWITGNSKKSAEASNASKEVGNAKVDEKAAEKAAESASTPAEAAEAVVNNMSSSAKEGDVAVTEIAAVEKFKAKQEKNNGTVEVLGHASNAKIMVKTNRHAARVILNAISGKDNGLIRLSNSILAITPQYIKYGKAIGDLANEHGLTKESLQEKLNQLHLEFSNNALSRVEIPRGVDLAYIDDTKTIAANMQVGPGGYVERIAIDDSKLTQGENDTVMLALSAEAVKWVIVDYNKADAIKFTRETQKQYTELTKNLESVSKTLSRFNSELYPVVEKHVKKHVTGPTSIMGVLVRLGRHNTRGLTSYIRIINKIQDSVIAAEKRKEAARKRIQKKVGGKVNLPG